MKSVASKLKADSGQVRIQGRGRTVRHGPQSSRSDVGAAPSGTQGPSGTEWDRALPSVMRRYIITAYLGQTVGVLFFAFWADQSFSVLGTNCSEQLSLSSERSTKFNHVLQRQPARTRTRPPRGTGGSCGISAGAELCKGRRFTDSTPHDHENRQLRAQVV